MSYILTYENLTYVKVKVKVMTRLVPQLKIKIQDKQDPTPLQDFSIQDPPGSHTKPEF